MTRSASRQRGRRGVTLAEVLATMVLIGIVLPVAMQGVNLSLGAASRARHTSEAAQLAEAKLNELLVVRDVSLLSGTGNFGADWPEYRWQSESVAGDWGLYEVHVTVTWTERGQERSLTLSSLVLPESEVTAS